MKKFLLCILISACCFASSAQQKLTANFLEHIGDTVVISGKIYNGAFLTNVKTRPTFLNLGDTSPSTRLMIRIEPEDREKFPSPPESFYLHKTINVTGVLQNYKGTAMIKVAEPSMIQTDAGTAIDDVAVLNKPVAAPVTQNVPVEKETAVTKKSEVLQADTALQTKWIKEVTSQAAELSRKNQRIVHKDIELKTAPNEDAPIIAVLTKGMVISVVYKSRKWSYVNVASMDGSRNIIGFIKNRKFRSLKKAG